MCIRDRPVSARAAAADHRRWRWQQRLAPAAVEMGVAAPGRPDGADADGLPFPAGHEQMEQGGAPVVFLHLVQLARRAATRLRDGGAADRRDDDGQGLKSDLPPGSPQVPRWAQDHGRRVYPCQSEARQISWRMELHDSTQQLTPVVNLIYLRCLREYLAIEDELQKNMEGQKNDHA